MKNEVRHGHPPARLRVRNYSTFVSLISTRQYIQDIRKLGYKDIELSELVAMALHEVSIDYIRQIHTQDLKNSTIPKLISFRIYDVEVDYIKKFKN